MRLTKLFIVMLVALSISACGSRGAVRQSDTRQNIQPRPQVQSVSVPEQVKRLYQSALADLQRKDYKNAEDKLLSVSQQAPVLATPMINLGVIYLEQGRIAEAESALNKAIAANPRIPQAYNYQGIVYRELGKFSQAEQAYVTALNLAPNYAIAHRNLGILYDLYFKNYGKAAQHYARYAELTPNENKVVQTWLLDLQQRATASN